MVSGVIAHHPSDIFAHSASNEVDGSPSGISRHSTIMSQTMNVIHRNYCSYLSERLITDKALNTMQSDNCKNWQSISYENGSRYVGCTHNGKRCGKGKILNQGNLYDGQWESDLPNGNGNLYLNNGVTYEGEWVHGLPHGNGIVRLPGGSSYVGEWKDGCCEGMGKFVSPNGSVYSGMFNNGMPNGEGTLMTASGQCLTCSFVDGVPSGIGEIEWPEKKYRYLGTIVNGVPHGLGMAMNETNVTLGLWRNGELETKFNAHDPIPDAIINDPAVYYIKSRITELSSEQATNVLQSSSLTEQ